MKKLLFGQLNTAPQPGNRAAIVFVHGFTGDWKATWGNIPRFLEDDSRLRGWDMFGFGYSSRRRFDLLGLWSADAGIEEIAGMLHTRCLSDLNAERYPALALVAHSMGGLVVQRALASHPDLLSRTTHLFLFGTPSNGLENAKRLSFAKQQIENMRAGCDFITRVRKDWTAARLTHPSLHFTTVAGELDQFVPPGSSLTPFPEDCRRVVPGNHVTMLDVASPADPSVKILIDGLTGNAAPAGPRTAARLAVESGHFQQLIYQLWPNGQAMPTGLDDSRAVQLSIALDHVGRRDDAIAVLRAHKPHGTDVLGVLAGRLKRRWIVAGREEDYSAALDLYHRGYSGAQSQIPPDHDQAYYHGINLAFLELAHEENHAAKMERAQRLAHEVLEHCQAAANPQALHWRLATEGDALIILGKWEEGLRRHREAKALNPQPWEALSMEEQAIRIARLTGRTEDDVNKLADIYEGPE